MAGSRPRPKNIKARREQRSDSRFTPDGLDLRLASTQKWILLLAAFVVPLVVLPESNFIDYTSIPKTSILRILGSLQAGVLLSRLLLRLTTGTDDPRQTIRAMLEPVRSSKPATMILASIAAVVTVSVISTLFSIVPHQSWWGRNPSGFEAGEFSALMYVILTISAFISAREARNPAIVWQVLAITGVAASFIGFLQFFDLSLLDISATQGERITGTNGNPIFFGAMLTMLAPVTIGVLFQRYQNSSVEMQKLWLAALAVSSFLLSFSLIATVSRGPWLGALIGGIAVVILVITMARAKAIIVPAIVTIVFIGLGALMAIVLDTGQSVPLIPGTTTSTTSARSIASIGRTSTLSIRLNYWTISTEMALGRDPIPYTKDSPKIVRWLFGYGPDTFRYAGTYYTDDVIFTRRFTAAHNDPINRLAEQGFLGILAWTALWVSLLYGIVSLLKRYGKNSKNASLWTAIAVTAALGARFSEQMFGSPTPGGILVFWIIVGGLLAMLLRTGDVIPKRKTLPTHSSQPMKYVSYSGVALIALVSVIFAYDKGASYLLATQSASFLNRPHIVSPENAIDRLKRSTNLAPDVPYYWHGLADIEAGIAENTNDPDVKLEALTRSYEYALKAYEANPIEIGSIYELAFATWELGKTGMPEFQQKTIELYERLILLAPGDALAKERLITLNESIGR